VNLAARYEIDLASSRRAGISLLVGGLVLAHLPASIGVPCPLRTLTGVPCPFCGVTTAVRATLDGHVGSALNAAPLGLLVVLLAALAAIGRGPRTLRIPTVVLVALLACEWLFELHRYHVLL
jgi:hypothetical protein